MNRAIYTIGHSNHPLEHFLDLLHEREVTCLVDVRSSPYSRYATQFNREALEHPLRREGIAYHWLGDVLGGRLVLPIAGESGHDFYQRLTTDPRFARGLAELQTLADTEPVVVMCSEGDPLRCHRTIIIGRELEQRGWNVLHISPDGHTMDQRAVHDELLARARPVQTNLWDASPADESADPYTQQENVIAPRWKAVPGTAEEDDW